MIAKIVDGSRINAISIDDAGDHAKPEGTGPREHKELGVPARCNVLERPTHLPETADTPGDV
jgi:hypothetical protein